MDGKSSSYFFFNFYPFTQKPTKYINQEQNCVFQGTAFYKIMADFVQFPSVHLSKISQLIESL